MDLPIRTTVEDLDTITEYLSKKPTGSTRKEAKSVLGGTPLDGRKVSAYKTWGIIEDREDKYKITPRGRNISKGGVSKKNAILDILKEIEPYRATVERASFRNEDVLNKSEVAAHWHDHYGEFVSKKERVLNDQAVCFFRLLEGAGIGNFLRGRRGSETRIEFIKEEVDSFVNSSNGQSSNDNTSEPDEVVDDSTPEVPVNDDSNSNGQETEDEKLGSGIFIAHGKKKEPLEQLKKILDEFNIPYKVAIDEPNLGRPIGKKIKEIMKSCNCAILLFTADEKFVDEEGNELWRPSENVIYELGASGYLYDNRIVIMKDEKVDFPTNFRDLGYISFEADQLEAKATEILKELIGFNIVKVST